MATTYTNTIHVDQDGVVTFRGGIGFSVSNIIIWSVLIGGVNHSIDALELADGQLVIGSFGARPVASNITSTDGSITVTNGPGTIDLSSGHSFTGTVQTNNTTPATISFPLATFQSLYAIEALLTASATATPLHPSGTVFQLFVGARTDGTDVTIIGPQEMSQLSEGIMQECNVVVNASGNSIVFTVTGVDTYLVNWKVEMKYVMDVV